MSDLISRQKALASHQRMYDAKSGIEWVPVFWIENLPSAQPERKKGKWTKENSCEFCGFQPWFERDIHTLSYCPNCGADMKGEEDKEIWVYDE